MFIGGRLGESAKWFAFVESRLESFGMHLTFVVACLERSPSWFAFFQDVLGWLAGGGEDPIRLVRMVNEILRLVRCDV